MSRKSTRQELQGAPLLLALLQACQQRQGMTTGSLLEYFRDTEHVDVLQKLANLPANCNLPNALACCR